jgi:hypothetical protein
MPLLSLLALFLVLLARASTAFGGEPASPAVVSSGTQPTAAIWSALVLATNDAHPAAAPAKLGKYAAKLKNIFGYNQFELIGEHSERMDEPNEGWLVPSKDFCLSVRTHNVPGEQPYPMKIALFQNRRRLVEFEPHLSPESPLFIRGPLYAGGQLIIVLHVVPIEAPRIEATRRVSPLMLPEVRPRLVVPFESPVFVGPRSLIFPGVEVGGTGGGEAGEGIRGNYEFRIMNYEGQRGR